MFNQLKVAGRAGNIDQAIVCVWAPAKTRLPDPGTLQRLLQFRRTSLCQFDETRLNFTVLEHVQHVAIVVPDQVVERGKLLQECLRLIMFELTIDLIIDLVADDDRHLVVGTEVDQHITQAFPFRHIAIGHGQPVKLLRQCGTRAHHHPHAEP